MKKGQLNQLSGFALTIVIFAVVLAVGFSMLGRFVSTSCSGTLLNGRCYSSYTNETVYTLDESYSFNSTSTITRAMADIPNWIPIIIIAVVGGLILVIISRQFRG